MLQSITEAAAAISSEQSFNYGGNGAIRANASEALTEFATQLNIPVANTFMGKESFPSFVGSGIAAARLHQLWLVWLLPLAMT